MSNGARLSAVIVVVAVAAIGLYFAFMTPSGPARTENPKAPVDALVAPDAAAGIGEMSGSAAAAAGADNGAPAPEAFGAGSGTISVPGTTDPAGSTIAAPGAGAGSIAGGAAGAAAANANSTRTATPVTPTGSGTAGDEFVYQASSAGGGLAVSKDIIASFFFGNEAFGIPALTGDDPLSPKIVITDTPDKSDPLNQLITVGVKLYFATLRLAAGNTGSTNNPTWYLVHRTKTSSTL